MGSERDRARIIGILPKWPGWTLTTPHIGFLHAVLRFLGEKVSPTFVMGVSGEAFKVFVTVPPVKSCGLIEAETFIGTALAAFGYEYETMDGEDPEEIIPALSRFIDKGMPVLAWNVGEVPEWGAVLGYHKSRGTVITQGILTPQGEVSEQKVRELTEQNNCYAIVGIKERKETEPDMTAVAREALVRAVAIYERGEVTIYDACSRKDIGPLITGIDAYGALIRWLEEADEDELAAHSEWDFPYLPLVLSSCRKSAGIFAREIAYRFEPGAAKILSSISRHYGRAAETFVQLKKLFPFPGVPEDLLEIRNRMKAAELFTHAITAERRALSDLKAFVRH
ncbi:MAG: hypothetical protein ABIH04_04865 [Planctomycetota bacterium]